MGCYKLHELYMYMLKGKESGEIKEGEGVNKKPRSRENIVQHSEGNADNKRQRNRRLEYQRHRGW